MSDIKRTANPQGLPSGGAPRWTVWGIVVKVLYFLAVLTYPVTKWIMGLDVFIHFVLMLVMWNRPGAHAGWTFLIHLGACTFLTWFVEHYQPSDESKPA